MYDSFRKYQTELLAEFERLAKEYNFEVIDATPDVRTVFEHLRAGVARVLSGEPREPLFSVVTPAGETAEAATKKVLEMPAKPAAQASEEPSSAAQALTRSVEGDATK
jgi:dTMP kinase